MNKKLLSGLLVCLLSVTAVFATSTESSSRSTSYPGNFNFKASSADGKVAMSWNQFAVPSGKSFAYYKVIRSQTKDNPLYPEDGYIMYDSNISTTSYTDESPLAGKAYYRVCAILDGQKRYCSNVVKIDNVGTYGNTSEKKEEKVGTQNLASDNKKTTTSTDLSDTAKASIQAMATAFIAKVNAKYRTEGIKRNDVLNGVVIQLENLAKKNSKLKATIKYLVTQIQAEIDELEDIKSILNVE